MLTVDFSQGLPPLRAGIYRHWKGSLYQVIGYAHDANADTLLDGSGREVRALGERPVVVYFGLELDDAHNGPRLAVRTAEDFFRLVCSVCGSDWECDLPHIGVSVEPVARFEYVAAEYYSGHRSGHPV